MIQRCLVTGPSGFVGSHLVDALLARGYAVRCLVRRSSSRDFLRDERLEFAIGDVTDPGSLPAAVDGCDYVFHVAGLVKARRESDFFTVNSLGTANLLEAMASASGSGGARRFVLISSLAAVGPPTTDAPLDESTPLRPMTPYGKSKQLAESICAAWAGRLPITIIRPPAVYGPRDRETLAAFRMIYRGISPVPARDQRISLVHARDLVEGIVRSAESPAGAGRTYLLAGAEDVTLSGLSRSIASALGRRPLTLALPPATFAIAGELNGLLGRAIGRPAIFDRDKGAEMAQRHWVCDSSRAVAEIGYAPRTAAADGLRETAEWYRRAGWL